MLVLSRISRRILKREMRRPASLTVKYSPAQESRLRCCLSLAFLGGLRERSAILAVKGFLTARVAEEAAQSAEQVIR